MYAKHLVCAGHVIGILEMEMVMINSLYSSPLKKKNHVLAISSSFKKKKKTLWLSPAQVQSALNIPHPSYQERNQFDNVTHINLRYLILQTLKSNEYNGIGQ